MLVSAKLHQALSISVGQLQHRMISLAYSNHQGWTMILRASIQVQDQLIINKLAIVKSRCNRETWARALVHQEDSTSTSIKSMPDFNCSRALSNIRTHQKLRCRAIRMSDHLIISTSKISNPNWQRPTVSIMHKIEVEPSQIHKRTTITTWSKKAEE